LFRFHGRPVLATRKFGRHGKSRIARPASERKPFLFTTMALLRRCLLDVRIRQGDPDITQLECGVLARDLEERSGLALDPTEAQARLRKPLAGASHSTPSAASGER
jgi:hypothetical protein